MPARLYQYDSIVTPISTAKESVHVDAWMQPPTQPQRNWAIRTAAFAVVLAAASGMASMDPKVLTQKEAVSVDKWAQPTNQPVRTPVQPQRYSQFTIDPKLLTQKEAVFIDKFEATYPDHLDRQYPLATYAFVSSLQRVAAAGETVTIDKWWQPASIPTVLPRSIAQTASSGHNEFPVVLYHYQPRSYYADSISRKFPEAVYAASSWIDPKLFTQAESVSIDRWGQPTNQPTRLLARASLGWYVTDIKTPTVSETVTLDKWFQAASLPTRFLPSDAVLYQTVIDPRLLTQQESVSIDRWGQPVSQPVRLLQRTALGWYVTDPKVVTSTEVVTIDKWFQPTSVPVRLLRSVAQSASSGHQEFPVVQYHFQPRSYYPDYIPRTFPSGVYLVSSHLEGFHQSHGAYTPFYAQYPSWISRVFPTAVYASSGAGPAKVIAPEVVTLDKWFQPASLPTRLLASSPVLYQFVTDLRGIPPQVSLAGWWQAASIPTRLAPRSPVLYQVVIDQKLLTSQEAVSIDKFGPDFPAWIVRTFPEATYYASGAVGVISTSAGVVVVINFISPGMHNFISQEIGPGVEN